MPTDPPTINFDAVTRNPVYAEVVVTANAVDPATGSNPGSIDTSTTLTFDFLQGGPGPAPAAVNITEIGQAAGARVLRFAPGITTSGQPWSVRVSAAGRTGTVTFSGTTPAPADVSGVSWNGVGPQVTPPA